MLKLDVLDAATSLDDVTHTPGCQIEPLRGSARNLYTLLVDDPWRLVFRYEDGSFHDVWLKEFSA